MAAQDRPAATGGLGALFDASSMTNVHTSGWALTAFLAGLGAMLTRPFSLTSGLRYLDVGNAYGDAPPPTSQDLMERLNAQVGVG